jgi:GxxExxY protein
MNTNKHESNPELDSIVESVIGAAYAVSNVLGAGFLEKVYERALPRELGSRGLRTLAQVCYPVSYKGRLVGESSPTCSLRNVFWSN